MSMRFAVLFLTLWLYWCVGANAGAQEVVYYSDIGKAQAAAAGSSKRILLFFRSDGSPTSSHYEKLFEQPAIKRVLAEKYAVARLDFSKNSQAAFRLGVYKTGSIALYDSAGKPLGITSEMLEEQALLSKLEGSSDATAASSSKPTPGLTPRGTPVPALPKGQLVKGPISVAADSGAPIDLGNLQIGKRYVLELEGVYSMWADKSDGVDALYIYGPPTGSGQPVPSKAMQFTGSNLDLHQFFAKQRGAQVPAYNPSHVYDLYLEGSGIPISLTLTKAGKPSGELTLNLYEAGS